MKVLFQTFNSEQPSFEQNIFHITYADAISDCLSVLKKHSFDCIILHLNKNENGYELINWLNTQNRQEGLILILHDFTSSQTVQYFNAGADDCILHKINNEELFARIGAVVRRKKFNSRSNLYFANLVIDFNLRTVHVWEKLLLLTKKEYDILLYLIAKKDQIVSKEELVNELWETFPNDSVSFDFLFAHIKNLKTKLKSAKAEMVIKNNYGVGYQIIENLY